MTGFKTDLTGTRKARGNDGGLRLQLAVLFALFAATGVAVSAATQGNPADASSVEQAVEQVLKTHPELVRDALAALQSREAADKAQKDARILADSSKAINADTGALVLGNPAGDVTVVEFLDYQCGYCKKMSAGIEQLIQQDPQLRVLIKQFPILGPDSIAAAQLALTNRQSPLASQMHQSMMSTHKLDSASLREIEQRYGLQPTDPVGANRALGEVRVLAEQLGIQGTPALIIGDHVYRGAVDIAVLEEAIRTARRGTPVQKQSS